MRIAIVGTGIAGLVVAHLLHPRHEITLFEAAGHVGGHTHTLAVETANASLQVDTGFIVYNDRNYPTFERLLERLGVATQPSVMSFSVSCDHADFEYAGTPRGLFAQPRNLASPSFLGMLAEYLRFNRELRRLLDTDHRGPSLRDWLQQRQFSETFVERLVVPQVAAVWSADPRQLWSFPAAFLARFFEQHGVLSLTGRPRWRTIAGGSARYVEALIAPFADRIHLNTPVVAVRRAPDRVLVTPAGGGAQPFDEVVIAAHADQALHMLADPSERERELLGAFPYQDNDAVLHTDRRLLPRRRAAWASWNYHVLAEPVGRPTVTYHLNTLQRLRADREICVTLNRPDAIDPAHVIATIPFAHPVFTPRGWAAQARHAEISGVNRTHYCGAYWRWGFHEDGAASGVRVAEHFGARLT